jgi:hypothetical protein
MLATDQPRRVLPADVYDALELSAEAYGGVGVHHWFEDVAGENIPCCIQGHGFFVDNGYGDVLRALTSAFDGHSFSVVSANDGCFTIEERTAKARIPFAEWCDRLNVVRGE